MQEFLFGGTSEPIVENSDSKLIVGQALIESLGAEDCDALCSEASYCKELVNTDVVTERVIVKLDKKAKLKGAQRTAVYTIARRRKDPKFKKLLTLWRLEAKIDKELWKKYKNEALKVAKQSMRNKPLPQAQAKHSPAVKNAIAKAKKQLNAR